LLELFLLELPDERFFESRQFGSRLVRLFAAVHVRPHWPSAVGERGAGGSQSEAEVLLDLHVVHFQPESLEPGLVGTGVGLHEQLLFLLFEFLLHVVGGRGLFERVDGEVVEDVLVEQLDHVLDLAHLPEPRFAAQFEDSEQHDRLEDDGRTEVDQALGGDLLLGLAKEDYLQAQGRPDHAQREVAAQERFGGELRGEREEQVVFGG